MSATSGKTSKTLFPIGKAAEMINIKEHTLRFWQQHFPEIKYIIGKGNRKYYDMKAIEQFKKIKDLMYNQGMKIAGVQKMISKNKLSSRRIKYSMQSPDIDLDINEDEAQSSSGSTANESDAKLWDEVLPILKEEAKSANVKESAPLYSEELIKELLKCLDKLEKTLAS